MTNQEAREEYKRIANRSGQTPEDFNHVVSQLVEEDSSPEQWVAAAKRARFFCKRCAGTGSFITYIENGVPRGPGGACYRCGGKGSQNDADRRRNYGYDRSFRILESL